MSKDFMQSSEKRDVEMERMVTAIRESQSATDLMDEAFANLLGINRTDSRCLDILERRGSITAGELAAEAGLTTGAVTPLLDRLERAGYVRRRRDTNDRRKVFVEITELANELGDLVYDQMRAFGANEATQMPISDIRIIARFMRASAALNRGLAEVLVAHTPPAAADAKARVAAAQAFVTDMRRAHAALDEKIAAAWTKG